MRAGPPCPGTREGGRVLCHKQRGTANGKCWTRSRRAGSGGEWKLGRSGSAPVGPRARRGAPAMTRPTTKHEALTHRPLSHSLSRNPLPPYLSLSVCVSCYPLRSCGQRLVPMTCTRRPRPPPLRGKKPPAGPRGLLARPTGQALIMTHLTMRAKALDPPSAPPSTPRGDRRFSCVPRKEREEPRRPGHVGHAACRPDEEHADAGRPTAAA